MRTHTHAETNDAGATTTTITGHFKLANDIVFTFSDFEENGAYCNEGWGWTPIGHNNKNSYFSGARFHGSFDGAGHAIKNVVINRPAGYWYNGLFAYLEGDAHLCNLTLEGFNITADNSGAVCGQVLPGSGVVVEDIAVKNCRITGINTASKPSGLLIGCASGTIRNVRITDSAYDRGTSSWHGGFIVSEMSEGILENVTVSHCTLKPYAYASLLCARIGNTTIRNIKIIDSEVEPTHDGWSYLVHSGKSSSLSNITIDVRIADNGYSKGAKALTPKPATEGDIPISLDNIDMRVDFGNSNVEHFNIQKNSIYMTSRVAGKGFTVANGELTADLTSGGTVDPDGTFAQGTLTPPVRDGYIFDGWHDNADLTGSAVTAPVTGTTYYAKWRELSNALFKDISVVYGSSRTLPTVSGITLSWESADSSVATVEGGTLKAANAGTTTLTAVATTPAGGRVTRTVNVEVTPLPISYGPASSTDPADGLPYLTYVPTGGMAPTISDKLGFYPVKAGGSTGLPFAPDTSQPKITLVPGRDIMYVYEMNGHEIVTDTLPLAPTYDSNGQPHSIEVKMRLINDNYRFQTMGTGWKPADTAIFHVTVHEEGMRQVDLLVGGVRVDLFGADAEYEYTGDPVVPTADDLTKLTTDGGGIDRFTVHFHPISSEDDFAGTHLTSQPAAQLTAEAVRAIAPTEPGVYSFVVNGSSDEAYCYASRHYSIVKGRPVGTPDVSATTEGASLAEVALAGTMKNAAGKPVPGTFAWADPTQTVAQGTAYRWVFTPDDTTRYEVAEGTAVAWPAHDTHEWEDAFTVDKAPTQDEAGMKSVHCKACDEVRDVTVIPALSTWKVPVTANGALGEGRLLVAGEAADADRALLEAAMAGTWAKDFAGKRAWMVEVTLLSTDTWDAVHDERVSFTLPLPEGVTADTYRTFNFVALHLKPNGEVEAVDVEATAEGLIIESTLSPFAIGYAPEGGWPKEGGENAGGDNGDENRGRTLWGTRLPSTGDAFADAALALAACALMAGGVLRLTRNRRMR